MKMLKVILLAMALAVAVGSLAQQPAAQQKEEAKAAQAPPQRRQEPNTATLPGQTLAHASNEAAEGNETDAFKHSPVVRWVASKLGISIQAEYWVLYTIDFLIIALAIGWIWKKNVPAAFRERTTSIRKTMDEAQAASADANRRLGDIEGRLSKLDQEIAQMRAQAEAEAAAEESRIQAAAAADARKIVEAAQAEIESASRVAQRELKAYAAELAVTMAEKRIQVDANTDRQLVQQFARSLAGSDGKESR